MNYLGQKILSAQKRYCRSLREAQIQATALALYHRSGCYCVYHDQEPWFTIEFSNSKPQNDRCLFTAEADPAEAPRRWGDCYLGADQRITNTPPDVIS